MSVKLRAALLRHPWTVIAVAVLLAYWPLSSFTYTLTHGDTLDCWLPWRFFIATCLQDGHFPLWQPLQQMGYPIYADLQGPAWYVEAIALGGTIGHSILTLQALFLGYLIVGGLGMRRLILHMHRHEGAALIIGMAYGLGGFFTGHTMHFYSVISAAWLPWALEAQLRLMKAPHWRPALTAAVFQYFLLSGGNHTFTILSAYLLAALLAVRMVQHWRSNSFTEMRRLIGHELLFALATALMACGTLYATWEVVPHLERAKGLSHPEAAVFPFTMRACISLLLPFAVGADGRMPGTDPAMANGYMGVLVLLFAGSALVRKWGPEEKVIAGFGGLCFAAAFGTALPVHHALWAALPGMDLFRSPAYFLWGAQLAVLCLAAGTLARWSTQDVQRRRRMRWMCGIALLMVSGVMAWAFIHREGRPIDAGLYHRLRGSDTAHRVMLNGIGLWLVLTVACLAAWRDRLTVAVIGTLVLLEMLWGTGLAAWNTSVADVHPLVVKARIDAQQPLPFIPRLEPMGKATDDQAGLRHLWRNTQVFKGHPTHGGFNTFQLTHTKALLDGHAGLVEAMARMPLLYLSDHLIPLARYVPEEVDPENDSALVVVDALPVVPMRVDKASRVELIGFEHDRFSALVMNDAPAFLLVQQAWFPGWHILVDGTEVPVVRANIAAFGALVPAGTHRVVVAFRKPLVPWLLAVSMLALFTAMGLLAWKAGRIRPLAVALLLLLTLLALFGHRPRSVRLEEDLASLSPPPGLPVIVNTDRPGSVKPTLRGGEAVLRCERPTDMPVLLGHLNTVQGSQAELWSIGLELPDGGAELLDDRGWRIEEREELTAAVRHRLVRQPPAHPGTRLLMDALGGGKAICSPDAPWSPAYRIVVGDLARIEGDVLAIDLEYRSAPGARGMIVIQREREGRVPFYEAVPINDPHRSDTTWTPALVLRRRRELRDAQEELAIYVWNGAADTLWARNLRVRMLRSE